ncbi:MAG: T9SS type A sorting domain-containing protein [Bacteroidia bacterium]
MKNHSGRIVLLILLTAAASLPAQVTHVLDIPPRLQWDNDGGYCGETSIQSIALYYGNYISQDFCRNVAGGEVLIGNDNGEVALDAFSFNIEEWDYGQATPQYQDHLVWLKSHIARDHPVIITVFVAGENSSEYDHIVPAIGYSSTDTTAFHNSDQLMFNDNYASTTYTRTFGSIWDDRFMNGNGATYDYCIPQEVNYACAVTGIKDLAHVTKPLHMSINRWDEPNVTQGENPVLLTGTLVAESLQVGNRYALLRYNDYHLVPSSGFNPTGASSTTYFVATGSTYTTTATFMSNTAVFFRCVPDIFTSTEPESTDQQIEVSAYPNPVTDFLHVVAPANANIEILGMDGRLISSKSNRKPKNALDVRELSSGTYVLRVSAGGRVAARKFVKE